MGANLGVLASLMQTMTPTMPQYNPMEEANQQALLQGRRSGNETALIKLAELKRSQASEQEVMAAIQRDPSLQALLFGGGMPQSTLGSLGTAPGGQPPAPAPGPITQSPLGPGGGPTQQIPASPDASRFANVPPQGGGPIPPNVMAQTMPTVTPPQGTPTLATLGPQGGMPGPPQGPMQAPQNPLLEMARRDPRAALMLQQQMQAQQEQQWKNEERRLDMGVKIAEGVAQELSTVKDQASLDASRERIRIYHPQAAAQIPQFYSKEALEPLIMKGVAVKDLALWRKNMAQAKQADMMTEQLPATFRALEGFATGGTPQAPTGEAAPTTTAAPTTGRPAGGGGQAPQESDTTRAIRAEVVRQGGDQALADLAVAVATQESYLKPNEVGDGGKALGLFQLHRGAAIDAKIDPDRRGEPALNIQGGVTYLKQKLAQSNGNVDEALKLYNGGGDPNYVANVRRFLPGGTAPAGGTTGTAQAPATDPRIAQLRTRIEQGNKAARQAEFSGMEGPARQVRAEVNDLQRELEKLEERSTEIPRAVAKQAALEPGELRQARAGAEVQREAKQYEPIGIQAADELDLPASTLWKDVPKDRKPMPRPDKGERDALSGLRASVAGVDSLLTKLDDPKIAGMVGTIFTEPPAAVNRLLGPWLATLPPEQRAFAATMAGEIMEIRHRLIGAGQTGIEVAALTPMMPDTADTDPATVRAKLTALREGMLRRHNAKRDDLAGMGFRVPDKLAAPPPSASGLTADQQRLLDKHTTR